MKKVLIISYHFPPRPTTGGLRIQGLAKYLPEFGWEPIILTPTLLNHPDTKFRVIQTSYSDIITYWKKRFGLRPEKGVKEQFGIITNKGKKSLIDSILIFLEEIIAYPDSQKGWYKFAVDAGDKLLQKEDFDAIISSSSPVTSHLIAKELKKRHKIPWVADLRDLWTQNHYYPYSQIRKFWEKRLELKTLREANALVTVSQPLAEKLKILHKGKLIHNILNGFDPKDFNVSHTNLTKKFTITYTGSLYQGKRDPTKLFEALQSLISEKKINSNDIEVRLYGSKEDWLEENIKYHKLQNIVKYYGVVPREIALKKQRESQLLLLLMWDNPHEKGVYTSKVFEYLATQRPILVTGIKEGVVEKLLKYTNAGVCAISVEDIKKIIEKFYNEYKEKGYVSYRGDKTKIKKYSQREMAKKFAMILDKVVRKK